MAKKPKKLFACQECGANYNKWSGKCATCGEWNTLVEESINTSIKAQGGSKLTTKPIGKSSVSHDKRLKTTMNGLDQVLGGGFVAGSVSMITGQPGIGKSTILLQIASLLANKNKVLYVSGEESPSQIGLRAKRLGIADNRVKLAVSSSANDIAASIATGEYDFAIVDSIQTCSVTEVSSNPGSVTQVTASAQAINDAAKKSNTATVLVGHVTKEGSMAGPKVLEHLVDVVLSFEGDRYGGFKVIRGVKNRFGSTNEAAILEMTDKGLEEVANPSAMLLAERQNTDGSVILATMEGSRPILVEIQALVTPTQFGYPKRAASGVDLNRLNLLVAMLTRRTKLNLGDKDIYINVVGGLKISEPGADLAICMAIGSAAKQLKVAEDTVVFGELGLSGEVRQVQWADRRVDEAKRLGFKQAVSSKQSKKVPLIKPVVTIRQALNGYLEKG